MWLQVSTETLIFLQPLYFSFQVGMFEEVTLATPHSASAVWLTRWLTPTQKKCVTHREVIRLYGVCCRRYGWHPRPFWNATSSYAHKLWSLGYRDAHVACWGLELFAILYCSHIIRRFRKIAESEYQLRRVCLSVRPHGKTRLPLDEIFMKFNISLFLENVEKIQVSLKSDTYSGYLA